MNRKEGGSILIVSVWMLALLFLLTISLSRRASHELLFVKYSLQKMQTRYSAWAGFQYAVQLVRQDSLDETSKLADDFFACGVHLPEGKTPEDLFKNVALSHGSFDIRVKESKDENSKTSYGLGDEDGKLNLNALNLQNYGVLKELLMIVGVPEEEALRMAAAVLDWRDEDNEPALGKARNQNEEGPFGWREQKLPAKNRPVDNLSELMFINGMTTEIYEKIHNFLTVFPRRAEKMQINFATAPREVLLALSRTSAGPATNTGRDDADSLTAKIVSTRAGADRLEGTADDLPLIAKNLNLTTSEENILQTMSHVQAKTSRFLSVHITGLAAASERKSHIDAVVDRETLTVVLWRAD